MSNSPNGKTYAVFANPLNRKTIAELENAAAQIVEFPVFEAEAVAQGENSDVIFSNLHSFDWIVFTDVLTVEFFLQKLEANQIDSFELDAHRVCAVGEAISDQLRFVQLHADVIPSRRKSPAVVEAMKNYIAETDFADLKILLPTQADGENELKDALPKTGADIVKLPVYAIKKQSSPKIAKAKALLKGGAVDEFVFTAETDFIWLEYLFAGEPLEKVLKEIKTSAADNLIFQTAREFNLKQTVLFQPRKIDTLEK